MHFALDNFQEKEIVRLSVPQGITIVEVEITLPLGVEYAEATAVITKGEAKIIQKAGTLLSQPTFVVTINKGNTITFEFNRKVTSQALLLKGELKDIVKLKVGEHLYDTKLSNSYYLRSPSLLLQPSPIVFDKKEGEYNDFFVLSNTGIGGVKDIYFSVDYPKEVFLIDLKYKGKEILPIGVVPAGYANAEAPLYRVEGTFFKEKKDRIIIYEHYTVANCQANCPIKYATYWGDNTLHFYETKEEIKLLHPKKEPAIITLSDDTYTVTTIESTTTTATTVGSVFTNDRLNGKPINIKKVIFSLLPQSAPNNGFVITKDGNIIIPAQTPIGCYALNYRICDNSQTSKDKNHKPICQTATVTIAVLQSVTTPTITTPTTTTSTTITATTTPTVVTPTVITLSDDTYTITTTESTTTTATIVGSVFTNDSMNGKPIDIQKVIFSLLPQSPPNTFIITKDGNIIVPPHTPIGRYILNYHICDSSQNSKEKNHKPICQTAIVTIAVLQSVTTPTTTTNTTVTATTTPTVITLSDDTYTLTTTESVTTTAATVGSVFTNDRLNGKPIDIQKVIFSLLPQSTPNTFIITKDGNIIIPAQTPIGRYTLNYRICDNSQTLKNKNHKPVCQTATVTIVVLQSVTAPTITTPTTVTNTTASTTVTATTTATVVTPTVITLSDDTYTVTTTASTTTTATAVGSVFANDRLNGKPIDIQKVIFSLLPQSTPNTFVITKDGNIIVPPHTPIGRYTLNYRICDNSQTSKDKNHKLVCQTATVTIAILQSVTTTTTTSSTVTATTTPTVITLSDDTYTITTTESTTTTATTVGSVFTNDRMNGKPIDIQKVIFSLLPQSTPNTFIITKDGNIIVPPQTPIGCYTLNYRICDNSQSSKDKSLKPVCQTATVTIVILQSVTTPTTTTSTTVTATTTATVVSPTVITLSDDTYTITTTESTTTTATTVGSVFSNDSMNRKPIDIQKVIFSLLSQSTPNTFVITKDGNIIIPAQTPIGRYTLNYSICDNSQPSKSKNQKYVCQTATVTIIILQSVTTPTITTSTTVTATTTTPTVITLSDDTYTVTTTASTTTTATTVGSVFTNDRMNGKPIDIQKVIFSLLPQSTPNTFIITKGGNIIIPAHTSIGRYILNYRICDNSQPSKNKNFKPVCQTATVTIAVLQSVTTPTTTTSTTVTATTTPTIITLSDDTYTVTTTASTTTTATTVGSVFSNDRLNGKPIDIQKVIFSLLPQSTPTSFVITKDGNIIVSPHTPIGRYTLNYRICDNSQPSKDKNHKPVCQTATVTIAVLQSVTTPTTTTSTTVTTTTTATVVSPTIITLSDDTYTVTTTESTTTTATTVGSVFSNDSMNRKPIDIQKVIFSLLPQSTPNTFIITKEGNIIVPPHTPIGRYTLNYRICGNSQPSKDKSLKPICQTATVTIAVLQSVTTSTTVTATITPTVITLSNDTYTLTTTESTTTTATTVDSVFSNDRLNGKPIDIQKVIFSLLPQSTPNTFIITKDGNIIVPAHTPIGRYTLNYRICDNSKTSKSKNQKSVCQKATVTIVVLQSVTTPTTTTPITVTSTTTPTVITLSDDTYTLTTTEGTTTTATTVGSVFTNDRLNGKPIDIQKVIFSLLPQSTPNTFIITKDGNIIVPPHTPIGRYTLNYRICDNSQILKDKSLKPICKTATVTIVILQSVTTPTTSTTITATTTTPTVITLSDDTYTVTTTESTTTTATTVGSVFTNDRLNGKPIDIQKVIFSLLPQSTPTSFIITKDGNIIVPSHTPIGRYTLNYSICDSKNKNQKPICQTATITITILQTPVTPTVSATVETDTSSTTQSATNQPIAVPDSVTTPMNTPIRIAVLDNDTPYTASPKIIVFPTNGDAFVKEDNTILYRPRVRFIGTDYFVYELCTPSSQSCTTATVTVKVTHKVVADNAMSANGDDKNDYFHIVGIENYPDNQVTIYNRNGEKVFTISHYNNRQRVFKGIVEGEVSLSNTAYLPQDTYFYLIEYYDENRQLQRQIGWLYLKR
ncbi:gliding motility-associated C-terminal domain-containing protein [Capnocytophaga leadbetteri]|uniref:T9SS type B sorting domain-containing protein n=1 Tax=Capnocytophaga leadbetteri TaxID=327575 RepID=UPI0028E27FA3|nr:gliding motility-associated C-terminal domain-containing protein [Capnocytophaga leadbetteri]